MSTNMYFQFLYSVFLNFWLIFTNAILFVHGDYKILREPSGSSWPAVWAILCARICVDDHFLSISCYLDLNVSIWALKCNGYLESLQGPSGCSWRATSVWLDVHQWVFSVSTSVNYQFQDFLINFYQRNSLYMWEIQFSFMRLQEAVDEPFQLNRKSFCINFFTNHHPKPFLAHGKSIGA